ncbi:hypothetical protein ALC62_01686, partial [Cyphomyrmex costatus]
IKAPYEKWLKNTEADDAAVARGGMVAEAQTSAQSERQPQPFLGLAVCASSLLRARRLSRFPRRARAAG